MAFAIGSGGESYRLRQNMQVKRSFPRPTNGTARVVEISPAQVVLQFGDIPRYVSLPRQAAELLFEPCDAPLQVAGAAADQWS